jgi:outer membrane protein OmpA-like peptidoglycan-associated protein
MSTAVVLLVLWRPSGMAAQTQAANPGASDAAAKAALGHAKVLNIVGITRGVEGLLKDLGAKVTGQEIKIALSADVLFDFDSFALRAEAADPLRKVADVLNDYPKSPVMIEGHTDGKGTDQYNQTLSDRRAESVKRWLADRGGVESGRVTTRGWGKTKPVAPNTKPDGSDDPEGRQKNRRVEITVRRAG